MSKKRLYPKRIDITAAKAVEIINGPDGPTRVYGGERTCEDCGAPLSRYNPAAICSLCQSKGKALKKSRAVDNR